MADIPQDRTIYNLDIKSKQPIYNVDVVVVENYHNIDVQSVVENNVVVTKRHHEYHIDIINNRVVINNTDIAIGTVPFFKTKVINSDYIVDITEDAIIVRATQPVAITLPIAQNRIGKAIRIKNSSNYPVDIITNDFSTIDDNPSKKLYYIYESVLLVCDGTNWCIM